MTAVHTDDELMLMGAVGDIAQSALAEREAFRAERRDQRERIQRLERRILRQRKALRELHESHAWELGTKELLVVTLDRLAGAPPTVGARVLQVFAEAALNEVANRDGPRPAPEQPATRSNEAMQRLSDQLVGR